MVRPVGALQRAVDSLFKKTGAKIPAWIHSPPAPPPDTSRLGGTAPHENDAAVLAVLALTWKLPRDELISCEVGMRNRQHQVYRRAAVKGVTQMLYLDEQMTALGFAPELEESEHHGSGFDIIYRYLGEATKSQR